MRWIKKRGRSRNIICRAYINRANSEAHIVRPARNNRSTKRRKKYNLCICKQNGPIQIARNQHRFGWLLFSSDFLTWFTTYSASNSHRLSGRMGRKSGGVPDWGLIAWLSDGRRPDRKAISITADIPFSRQLDISLDVYTKNKKKIKNPATKRMNEKKNKKYYT